MPVIDFKEIDNGDTFELFARDFLEHFNYLGCEILEGPGRGADGGKDLIFVEKRKGVFGTTEIKWLVSCKHYARSNKSVTPTAEPDILERVKSKECEGFLGFYSTIPSESLKSRLESLSRLPDTNRRIEFFIFDNEVIENYLLSYPDGILLAKRYFPNSINKWKGETKIFNGNVYIEESQDKQVLCTTWDIVLKENNIDSTELYWTFNSVNRSAELYLHSESHFSYLAELRLSSDDCVHFNNNGIAKPGSWSYVEFYRGEKINKFGLITLQYFLDDKKIYSQYQISYTRCNYLMNQLREELGDWDELSTTQANPETH